MHLRLCVLNVAAIVLDRTFQTRHDQATVLHHLSMQIDAAGWFYVIGFVVVATYIKHRHTNDAGDEIEIARRHIAAADDHVDVAVLPAQIDRAMQLRHLGIAYTEDFDHADCLRSSIAFRFDLAGVAAGEGIDHQTDIGA